MTSKLKAELDAIELYNVIKPMYNLLDEAIEYVTQETDYEVSSLDIIDYITTCMQEYLEDRGMLSEMEFEKPTEDDIWDALEELGSLSQVENYMKYISDNYKPKYDSWTISDWEQDFLGYIADEASYKGEDYISEEELMKEHFKRHAGL